MFPNKELIAAAKRLLKEDGITSEVPVTEAKATLKTMKSYGGKVVNVPNYIGENIENMEAYTLSEILRESKRKEEFVYLNGERYIYFDTTVNSELVMFIYYEGGID